MDLFQELIVWSKLMYRYRRLSRAWLRRSIASWVSLAYEINNRLFQCHQPKMTNHRTFNEAIANFASSIASFIWFSETSLIVARFFSGAEDWWFVLWSSLFMVSAGKGGSGMEWSVLMDRFDPVTGKWALFAVAGGGGFAICRIDIGYTAQFFQ